MGTDLGYQRADSDDEEGKGAADSTPPRSLSPLLLQGSYVAYEACNVYGPARDGAWTDGCYYYFTHMDELFSFIDVAYRRTSLSHTYSMRAVYYMGPRGLL